MSTQIRGAVWRKINSHYWLGREPGIPQVHVLDKQGKMRDNSLALRRAVHGQELETQLLPPGAVVPDTDMCSRCVRLLDLQTPRSPRDEYVRDVGKPGQPLLGL